MPPHVRAAFADLSRLGPFPAGLTFGEVTLERDDPGRADPRAVSDIVATICAESLVVQTPVATPTNPPVGIKPLPFSLALAIQKAARPEVVKITFDAVALFIGNDEAETFLKNERVHVQHLVIHAVDMSTPEEVARVARVGRALSRIGAVYRFRGNFVPHKPLPADVDGFAAIVDHDASREM